MAPTMVGEAVKGGMLLRKVLSEAQHDVLSPCVVNAPRHNAAPDTETEQFVRLPGASTCMASPEAIHAMLRAVEGCACMPAAEGDPLPQMLGTAATTYNLDRRSSGSVKGDSSGKNLAGAYKVCAVTSVHEELL